MTRLRTLLGAALRRHRHAQQRTLREVAEAAGISLTYLSEIERGRKEPSSEVLAALCDALGVVLSGLLREVADRLAHLEAVDAARERAPVGFGPDRPQPAAGNGTGAAAGRDQPADTAQTAKAQVIRLRDAAPSGAGETDEPAAGGVLDHLLQALHGGDLTVGASEDPDDQDPAARGLLLTPRNPRPHSARILDFQSYRARHSA